MNLINVLAVNRKQSGANMTEYSLNLTLDELPEEVREIAKKSRGLNKQNRAMLATIEQLGGSVDTTDARFEFTLHALKELGVITELQMWEISQRWELHLRRELQELLGRIKEQLEAQRRSSKLIVPDHLRR